MKTYFECIPCFIRQGLDAAKLITDDEKIQEEILRKVLTLASKMDLKQSPPEIGQKIHRIIRQISKNDDPYLEIKQKYNNLALKMYPELKQKIENSDNPLETAVRLAIAGNIIDYGVNSNVGKTKVKDTINKSLTAPFDKKDLEQFKNAISSAEHILYLGDNAGEIVFDKLLLEQLPLQKITFVVKGSPTINDATMQDAATTGLTEIVEVIDNGSDAPGTILNDCSENFQQRFEKADLIIAKGQGNYETLSDVDKEIFFILKVKCPVIARHLNCEVGSSILKRKKLELVKK